VDNPFMAGAAAYPAWLAVQCSFFDQDPRAQNRSRLNRPALMWCPVNKGFQPRSSHSGLAHGGQANFLT